MPIAFDEEAITFPISTQEMIEAVISGCDALDVVHEFLESLSTMRFRGWVKPDGEWIPVPLGEYHEKLLLHNTRKHLKKGSRSFKVAEGAIRKRLMGGDDWKEIEKFTVALFREGWIRLSNTARSDKIIAEAGTASKSILRRVGQTLKYLGMRDSASGEVDVYTPRSGSNPAETISYGEILFY